MTKYKGNKHITTIADDPNSEITHDSVFSEIDDNLATLIKNAHLIWEDQALLDRYHKIRNELVDLILEVN